MTEFSDHIVWFRLIRMLFSWLSFPQSFMLSSSWSKPLPWMSLLILTTSPCSPSWCPTMLVHTHSHTHTECCSIKHNSVHLKCFFWIAMKHLYKQKKKYLHDGVSRNINAGILVMKCCTCNMTVFCFYFLS